MRSIRTAKILNLFFCMVFSPPCYLWSAFEAKEQAARPLGFAGAYTAVASDSHSIWWNPAGLSQLDETEFSASYTQLFSISDLPYSIAGFAFPTGRFGGVGLGWTSFGPTDFQERTISIAHGFPLSESIDLGYALKYLTLSIGDDFGSASTIGVDLGVTARITSRSALGLSVKNVNDPVLGKSKVRIPSYFVAGGLWRFAQGIILSGDIERQPESDIKGRLGAEMIVLKQFAMRGGIQTNPSRIALGFGFMVRVVQLDYVYFSHPVLDGQHQITITIRFGKKENNNR